MTMGQNGAIQIGLVKYFMAVDKEVPAPAGKHFGVDLI